MQPISASLINTMGNATTAATQRWVCCPTQREHRPLALLSQRPIFTSTKCTLSSETDDTSEKNNNNSSNITISSPVADLILLIPMPDSLLRSETHRCFLTSWKKKSQPRAVTAQCSTDRLVQRAHAANVLTWMILRTKQSVAWLNSLFTPCTSVFSVLVLLSFICHVETTSVNVILTISEFNNKSCWRQDGERPTVATDFLKSLFSALWLSFLHHKLCWG